jgi:hypothetical protein
MALDFLVTSHRVLTVVTERVLVRCQPQSAGSSTGKQGRWTIVMLGLCHGCDGKQWFEVAVARIQTLERFASQNVRRRIVRPFGAQSSDGLLLRARAMIPAAICIVVPIRSGT